MVVGSIEVVELVAVLKAGLSTLALLTMWMFAFDDGSVMDCEQGVLIHEGHKQLQIG